MTATVIGRRISQFKQLLEEAQHAEGEAKDSQAALSSRNQQVKSLLSEIRAMIEKGESTGDLSYDLSILVRGTVEKDAIYRQLSRLQQRFEAHAGQLVAIEGRWTHDDWQIGKISKDSLGWIPPDYHNRERRVILPIDGALRGHNWLSSLREVEGQITLSMQIYSRDKLGQGMHIGTKEVQRWAERKKGDEAFVAWSASRRLGLPLQHFDALRAEIRRLREQQIPSLIAALGDLERLEGELKYRKEHPLSALQKNDRDLKIKQTANGVSIDFGYAEKIAKATEILRVHIDEGVNVLEMADNPTLQEAAKHIGYALRSAK